MESDTSFVTRIVQDNLLALADHARVLRELGSRLALVREEFVAAWKVNLQRETYLARLGEPNELSQEVTRELVDPLGEKDLSSYFAGVELWSETWRARGANYADSLCLMRTCRRTLVPFLLGAYAAGPDLELVFRALDALERANLNVLAAAEILATQMQLARGVHQRTVGRMMGGMAHALNNTLAILVGRSQILLEHVSDEDQRQELRDMQQIALAGAESLKRLHQFAPDRESAEPTRLDVNVIMNDVVQLARLLGHDDAEASGIEIQVTQDLLPVPPVMGQALSLRTALIELILNSIQVMPNGEGVLIRTEHLDDRVEITVVDQGQGMGEAMPARSAEPLLSSKGSGRVGLGLSTVKEIVRQMGGTLTLASVPGQGTTATIALPVAVEIAQAADSRRARLARWAKVLVVDDDPMVRDVAARSLQLRGFQTVAADSGAAALRMFGEQGPFQVVIVDLGMPRMNGFETAQAIKKLNARTIVILMTGWSVDLDPRKMREVGIDRVIAKPFEVDHMIQLIGEALAIQDKL